MRPVKFTSLKVDVSTPEVPSYKKFLQREPSTRKVGGTRKEVLSMSASTQTYLGDPQAAHP